MEQEEAAVVDAEVDTDDEGHDEDDRTSDIDKEDSPDTLQSRISVPPPAY